MLKTLLRKPLVLVSLGLLLALGGLVFAYTITVGDGLLTDWTLTPPSTANTAHVARSQDAAKEGEFIWLDHSGDDRNDFSNPSRDTRVDIVQFRATATATDLYFLIKMTDIDLTTGDGAPQVQIAIDRDHTSGNGVRGFEKAAETQTAAEAAWEYLVVTTFGSAGGAPLIYTAAGNTGDNAGSANAITGDAVDAIEIAVPWAKIGGVPTGPLYFTVASFRANVTDGVWDVGGGGIANALDVVTNYGAPGTTSNTWTEVEDGTVDFNFRVDFHLDATYDPSAPLLVQEVMYDPLTDKPEWIIVRNPGASSLSLKGFMVGDEETAGGDEGLVRFPDDATIAAGGTKVIAASATAYNTQYGAKPDFEWTATDETVPDMIDVNWSTGTIDLDNAGDEVLVLDPSYTIVDVLAYEGGAYPSVTNHTQDLTQGRSLVRAETDDTDRGAEPYFTSRPVITAPGNQTVLEDAAASDPALAVTIGDDETAAGTLTLDKQTSNATLLPLANIVLGGAGADRTVTVQPAANQSGTATVTLTVTDAAGATANASFVLTVTAVNDAPVLSEAGPIAKTVLEDKEAPGFEQALNATDVEGSTLTWSLSVDPSKGVVTGASGEGGSKTIAYTPSANANGTDTFTVQVSDGTDTDTVQFDVTITAVNDPPENDVAPVVSGTAAVGQTLSTTDGTWNDTKDGQAANTITYTYQWQKSAAGDCSNPSDITDATNSTYVVQAGDTSLRVKVTATDSGVPGTATASVFSNCVSASNSAPVLDQAGPIAKTVDEDVAAPGFEQELNATDADGDTITWSFSVPPTKGTATGATGTGGTKTIAYTPNLNENGADTFTVKVADGKGGEDTVRFDVTITAVADPPTLTEVQTFTGGTEDTAYTITFASLLDKANEADPDGATTFRFKIVEKTTGTLTKDGVTVNVGDYFAAADEKDLVWTPASNDNGTVNAFKVLANDGTSDSAGTGVQVKVELAAVNDVPTLTTVSNLTGASEDTDFAISFATFAAAANEADVDGDTLRFKIVAISTGTLKKGGSDVSPGDFFATGETLTWKGAADANGTLDAFTVKANDGTADSASAVQVKVVVAAVNDAPTLTTVSNLTGAQEKADFEIPFATLAAAANEADVDGDTLQFRIVAISSGTLKKGNTPVSAGDLFAAGETLTWKPTGNANGTLDAFTIKAFDGALDSATAVQVKVVVGAVNDAPTLTTVNDLTGATEDTDFAISFATLAAAADEADVDGDTLRFKIVAISTGTLKKGGSDVNPGDFFATGETLTWKGAQDANGTLNAFTVKANDGLLDSATAVQVKVVTSAVNDTPTLTTVNTLTNGTEDTDYSIPFATLAGAADEADVDGDTLRFTIVAVSSGTLKKGGSDVNPGDFFATGETLTWKGALDANGTLDAFTVKANDGTVDSATAVQVKVEVAAVNDAPTLTTVSNLTGATEDTDFAIPFADLAAAANEADVDGDTLRFKIVAISTGTLKKGGANVSAGDLFSAGETLTWKGAPDANGTLNAFTIKANDGSLDSASAIQVKVVTAAVNDTPTLTAVSNLTGASEDTDFSIPFATLLGAADEADVDGDTLRFKIIAISTGTLKKGVSDVNPGDFFATGETLTWKGALNANGTLDAFTVKVNDGTVDSASAVQVKVVVAAVNDTPTLTTVNTLTGALEDTDFAIPFATLASAANEADIDGDTLRFKIAAISTGTLKKGATPVNVGDFFATGETLTWKAAANANGTLNAFTVKANDGTVDSATAVQVKVEVVAVNDQPTFTKGADQTVNEDAAAQSVSGWATAINRGASNESGQTLEFLVTVPANQQYLFSALPAISATGTLTYTPATNKNGAATVSVALKDDGGTLNGGVDTSATVTFVITVDPINDPPVNTEAPSITGTVHKDEIVTALPGTWNDNNDQAPGTITFTYQWQASSSSASCGGLSNVNAVAGHPDQYKVKAGDKSIRVQVTATDNGEGTPASQSVTVASACLSATNHLPVITEGNDALPITMSEDSTPTAFSLTLNATDADGDTLTWSISSPATKGTATASGTGASKSIGYTPNANYHGGDSFTVKIDDGAGGTDQITINVTIIPVPDLPTFSGHSTLEDTQTAVGTGLVAKKSDLDGSEITHFKITDIQKGKLYASGVQVFKDGFVASDLNGLVQFTFTPDADFYDAKGEASVSVRASTSAGDAGLGPDTVKAVIAVSPVPDTPTITNATTAEDTMTSSGLVVTRNTVDGAEITHFKVTAINSGTLYKNNGTTVIPVNGFITAAEGTAGLKFKPSSNFNGAASIKLRASLSALDTGLGGGEATATITVTAVNDRPENSLPVAGLLTTVDEDADLLFKATNNNRITVSDLDVAETANGKLQVSLSVLHGLLTMTTLTGLQFSVGDGTNDKTMTFQGLPAAINTALNTLKYRPDLHFNTANGRTETLTVTTSDLGNTGSGGTLTKTDTVALYVTAVDDAPVLTVPATQSVDEEKTLTINGVTVDDDDEEDDPSQPNWEVTLTVTYGKITVNNVANISFQGGTGNNAATMRFRGTLAHLNTALAGMKYVPDTNKNKPDNGQETLTILLDDLGSYGKIVPSGQCVGTVCTDQKVLNIDVAQINDKPVISVIGGKSVNESATLTFTVNFTDPDQVGESHVVKIDWDDGDSSYQKTVDAGARSVSVSHVYADNRHGNYTAKVTITDALQKPAALTSDVATVLVTVNNVTPTGDAAGFNERATLTLNDPVYGPVDPAAPLPNIVNAGGADDGNQTIPEGYISGTECRPTPVNFLAGGRDVSPVDHKDGLYFRWDMGDGNWPQVVRNVLGVSTPYHSYAPNPTDAVAEGSGPPLYWFDTSVTPNVWKETRTWLAGKTHYFKKSNEAELEWVLLRETHAYLDDIQETIQADPTNIGAIVMEGGQPKLQSPFLVQVYTRDKDGAEVTKSIRVAVNNVAPLPRPAIKKGDGTLDFGIETEANVKLTVIAAQPFTLSAQQSCDPGWVDNRHLKYYWQVDTGDTNPDPTSPEWTFKYDFPGQNKPATLRVEDPSGASTTRNVLINVLAECETKPAIDAVAVDAQREGNELTLTGRVTGGGNAARTYTFYWNFGDGVQGTCAQPITGTATPSCSVKHTYSDNASRAVTLTVADELGCAVPVTRTLTIVNMPPVISVGEPKVTSGTVVEGVSFQVGVNYTDPGTIDTHTVSWDCNDDGTFEQVGTAATCTYFADDFPAGDDAIAGRPAEKHTVKVRVRDKDGGQADGQVAVTVKNGPPMVTTDTVVIGAQEGSPITLNASATDRGIDPGDSNFLFDWLFTLGSFTGAQTSIVFPDDGDWDGAVTATDNGGGAAAETSLPAPVKVRVNNLPPLVLGCFDANQAPADGCENVTEPDLPDKWVYANPILANAPDWCRRGDRDEEHRAVVPEVACLRFTALAHDPGTVDVQNLRFSWNFGDGQGVEAGLPKENWYVTHSYRASGEYTVTVTAEDPQGAKFTDEFTVVVEASKPFCDAVEVVTARPKECGQTEVEVTAHTVDDSPLFYLYEWGDQGFDAGDELSAISHKYTQDGLYELVVTLVDEEGQETVCPTKPIQVYNVLPVAALQAIPNDREGRAVRLQGAASDCSGDTTQGLRLVWSFGDGTDPVSGAAAVVDHVWKEPGDYTVTLTVEDDGHPTGPVGDPAPAVTNVATRAVKIANLAPEVAFLTRQTTGDEGACLELAVCATDPGGMPATPLAFTWKWDDNSPDTLDDGVVPVVQTCQPAEVGPSPCAACTGQCSRVFHAFPDNGSYRMQVLALDPQGASGGSARSFTIDNVAPTCNATSCPNSVDPQVLFLCQIAAVEPGVADRASLQWRFVGQPVPGMTLSADGTSGTVSWLPEVDQADKSFAWHLEVVDKDGGSCTFDRVTTVAKGDSDGDGMPDAYEKLTGVNNMGPAKCLRPNTNDGNSDSDQDGLTALEEFQRDDSGELSSPCASNAPHAPAALRPLNEAEARDLSPELAVVKATDPDQNITTYPANRADMSLRYLFVVEDALTGELVASNAPVLAGVQLLPAALKARQHCSSLLEGPAGNFPVTWRVPVQALEAYRMGTHRLIWKAMACDGWAFGPYSTPQTFVYNPVAEDPGQPTLVGPVHGTENVPIRPEFSAQPAELEDADGDQVTYTFRLWEQSDPDKSVVAFSAPVLKGEDGMARWTPPAPGLLDDTWYCWDVVAVDDEGRTTASAESWCFLTNTNNRAPNAPTLVDPISPQIFCGLQRRPGRNVREVGSTEQVELKWRDASDPDGNAITCKVLIVPQADWDAGAPGFASAGVQTYTDVDCAAGSFAVSGLSDNTFYYWTVIAVESVVGQGGQVESPNPMVGLFFVNLGNDWPVAPTAPTVAAATNQPTLQAVCAEDADFDTLTYACELHLGGVDGTIVENTSGIGEPAAPDTCPSNGWQCGISWKVNTKLVYNQDYCFRCRACDVGEGCTSEDEWGPWSECASFRPQGNICPEPVTEMLSPTDRSYHEYNQWPVFEVRNVANPDANAPLHYTFEVYTTDVIEAGTEPVLKAEADEGAEGTTTINFLADQVAELVAANEVGLFFWRVVVTDPQLDPTGTCPAAVSQLWRFNIKGEVIAPEKVDEGCCGHIASSEPPRTRGFGLLALIVGGLLLARRRRG